MNEFLLADGAILELADNGVDSEDVVFLHHGTPGHFSSWKVWLNLLGSVGIRAIATSRPGYGKSERRKGRRVIDIAAHTTRIADEYGIKRFISVGWSGGGPHALATTLDSRCIGVVTLAGVGQYGKSNLDFLAGMGPENIDEFGVALKGEVPLREWMKENAVSMQRVTGDDLRETFGGLIGEADKKVLEGDTADEMASSFRLGLAHGFDGWIDDDIAFIHDWGFDLEAISVPVHVWQGNDDFMVPHAHSIWLANTIPTAVTHFTPGHGHISLIVKESDKIVTQLQQLFANNSPISDAG